MFQENCVNIPRKVSSIPSILLSQNLKKNDHVLGFDAFISPPDTCYVLSFAIIMLNTSLHNPSVRDKPTIERFIQMNRGINEGGDLPEDLLKVRSRRWMQGYRSVIQCRML